MQYVFSGSDDGTIYYMNLRTRDDGWLQAHARGVTSVSFCSDCQYALSASLDGTAILGRSGLGDKYAKYNSGEDLGEPWWIILSVFLSTNTGYACAVPVPAHSYFGGLCPGVLSAKSGVPTRLLRCLSSRDGRYAPLSAGKDNSLRLLETASGHCVRSFNGHGDQIHSAFLSYDNIYALAGN